MKKKITLEELDAIHNFIRESRHHFEYMGCRACELMICIPNWLKIVLINYPLVDYISYHPSAEIERRKLYDFEIRPHYTDEVVLFFKDYHINPDYFKPAIHVIQFEDKK
ncbi:hypothetical protein ACSV4D_09395 [Flavobacterium sp. ARAG 55.4]|uniref:hypothetical protein n=1 Tax=Flavobacterium sp. ARAG 55.4 TaxID=3451357 RepID=UPI003F478741